MASAAPAQVWPEIAVAAVVVGFTAVPLSLEPFNAADLAGVFSVGAASDVISNVLGFVPLGLVLAWRGLWKAIAIAALLSVGAETIQFFSPLRSPSLADVSANVLGAALGVLISWRWGRPRLRLRITLPRAVLAALLALLGIVAGPALAPRALQRTLDQVMYAPRAALGLIATNPRGAGLAGRLEALWPFDANARDATGSGLDAVTINAPSYEPGAIGQAIVLNGSNQYAVAAPESAPQLAGSMSISAWIKPDPALRGDAAIVSTMSHLERGYQFYTTDDEDWRTIAIQLGSNNGVTVTRYGRTELMSNRWYFVTATYDAPNGALRVFVDGRPDDACQLGRPAHRQTVSGDALHIGRHGEDDIDYFHGALDDVRLYSRALSAAEVAALYASARRGGEASAASPAHDPIRCPSPPPQDPTSIGWLVIFGQLIAIALLGLRPGPMNRLAGLALWGISGLVVLPAVLSNALLPIPILALLLTLAGAASIFVAVRSSPNTG